MINVRMKIVRKEEGWWKKENNLGNRKRVKKYSV